MVTTENQTRKIVGQNRPKMDTNYQITAIEKEIRETPYHKGTERHIGILRARIARLRDKSESFSSKKSGGGGGYAVKQQGDATVVLVGPPSVGKSTLLNNLTNAQSKVAPYAFTTVTVIPGMMVYKNARIQILDVPGLIRGAEEGKGRGREVLSVIRGCDLILIMTDPNDLGAFERITKILEKNGVRINKRRPEVSFVKKPGGGLTIHSNIKQDLTKETIKEIIQEIGLKNAEINLKENLSLERLVDAFTRNVIYVPALFIINKIDQVSKVAGANLVHPSGGIVLTPVLYQEISAEKGNGLVELQEKIWESLNFVRVYLIRPDEEPSFNDPIIMKVGQTLYDVLEKIGSEFAEGKISAKIWGSGAKFAGQEVSLTIKVLEGMQIRFV